MTANTQPRRKALAEQGKAMIEPDILADDVLVGAAAIAAFLGLKPRQVYTMREVKNPLVASEPGLGLTARKSVLRARFGIATTTTAE